MRVTIPGTYMDAILFLQFEVFVKIVYKYHFSNISTHTRQIFDELIAHLHSVLSIESEGDDWQMI